MNQFFNQRKAQVTIFIIIGVVILLSAGIYAYLRTAGISPMEALQPRSPPVVEFVDACIEKTTTDAVRKMTGQGGYIELPPQIQANPTMHVSLVPGIGGKYAPKVPYWYYDGRMINPDIAHMEYQVETYINNNLGYCLRNFTAIEAEYTVTENSAYAADVVFTDKETIVELDYEIFIQPKGKEEITTVKEFTVRLDAPVRKMWALALEILNKENEMTFFENMTLNLMASHPSDDIPFTDITLACGRKTWLLSEIKRKAIDALVPAVGGVRFKGTYNPGFPLENEDRYIEIKRTIDEYRNRPILGAKRDDDNSITEIRMPRLPSDVPEDAYEYFQYYFQFTQDKSSYRDFKVAATYKEDWGMQLLGSPNRHGVLRSGTQDLKSEIMSFLCLQTYHFVYDVVYPVMISINAPEALHGQGLVFRYAFPVQIFHNQADRTLLPSQIIEPVEYVEEYCTNLKGDEYTIIAYDTVLGEGAELSRVNLTFICFDQACDLGRTKTNNRHLQWSGQFPEGCYAPIIRANRTGYLETEKQFDYSNPFYIDMFPTQKVTFDVKRHQQNAPASEKMLMQDMYAIIQIESMNPPLDIMENFGAEDVIRQTRTIDLLRADATYDLNIMLIRRGLGDAEDTIIGGWIGNWTVDMADMLDAEEVIFHIPEMYPNPRSDEDLIELFNIMTNRSMYPDLVPELVRADEERPAATDDSAEGGETA